MNTASERYSSLTEALKDSDYKPIVVMGDGQIAMMLVQECRRQGIPVIVIGDGKYAAQQLVSTPSEQAFWPDDFYINLWENWDPDLQQDVMTQLIQKLKKTWSGVTAEFENVTESLLVFFESQGVRLTPGRKAFSICRDKLLEKKLFQQKNVPCANFLELDPDTLEQKKTEINKLLPGFVKTRTMGYDGKWQRSVETFEEVQRVMEWDFLNQPCILEKKVDFDYEMSVVFSRDETWAIVINSVQKNHQKNLLITSESYGIPEETSKEAVEITKQLAEELEYLGTWAIEFFVIKDGSVLANEMAPRPHNSGHQTIDWNLLSQYSFQMLIAQRIDAIRSLEEYRHVWIENLYGTLFARPRHANSAVGLVNITGTTVKNIENFLWVRWVLPWNLAVFQMPGIFVRFYGKPDGKDTKRGHVTINWWREAVNGEIDRIRRLLHPNI